MSHKIKALVLAAFATLALSAVGVSLSQAETSAEDVVLKGGHTDNGKGEQELTSTTLTGTQKGTVEDNFFDTASGRVTCTNEGVDFTGTIGDQGETEEFTIEPHYNKCETIGEGGGQAVTVKMNECDYTFTPPDTTIEEGKRFTGEATLHCKENSAIEISVFLFRNGHTSHSFKVCTIKVAPTEGTHVPLGGHIIYQNIDNGSTQDHITAEATIEGIPYEGCGNAGDDGEYVSTVTLEGLSDDEEPHTESLDVWLEH